SFSQRSEKSGIEHDVFDFDANQLRDAKAGRVEELEHRTVAKTFRGCAVGRFEKRGDFVGVQRFWQRAPEFRVVEFLRRIVLEMPSGYEETKNAGDRSDGASARPH